MEQELSFENLPKAVTKLTKEVSELKTLLQERQVITSQPEQLLNIQQAADFLSLTVPTIYSKVSRAELPYMKRSKRLYFSRTELMNYLKTGRAKTNAEIEQRADQFLITKKRR